jgi:hypothetical protein
MSHNSTRVTKTALHICTFSRRTVQYTLLYAASSYHSFQPHSTKRVGTTTSPSDVRVQSLSGVFIGKNEELFKTEQANYLELKLRQN